MFWYSLKKQGVKGLFFLSMSMLVISCLSFGVKKDKQQEPQKDTKTQITHPLTVKSQPNDLCPQIVKSERDKQTNPHYFSYDLDTTDVNCIATKIEDLFGEGKMFSLNNENTLVFLPNHTQLRKNRKSYQQYHKSLPVKGTSVNLFYEHGKIVKIKGRIYPQLEMDTTGMLTTNMALQKAFEYANAYTGDWIEKYWLEDFLTNTKPFISSDLKTIIYSFEFGRAITEKVGRYQIDGQTGNLLNYYNNKLQNNLTDCSKYRTKAE